MTAKIKADVLQVLDDWKAGKPVRSIELGHIHRMKETPGGASPVIDTSIRLDVDQERAHAYLFKIIEDISTGKAYRAPENFDEFRSFCDVIEQDFDWGELPVSQKETFNAERDAAESLAWKALHIGWARAIAGHAPENYIEVTNPAAQVQMT